MNVAQVRSLAITDIEQGDEAAGIFQPTVRKPATDQYGTLARVTEEERALVNFSAAPAELISFNELAAA